MDPDFSPDLPDDEPFLMLNALWYKPDGGKEKYGEYLEATKPFTEKYGSKAMDVCVPEHAHFGEFDADLMFFVWWSSWKVFREFLKDPDYNAVTHLREEAITKSLLIRCKPLS